MTSRSMVPLLMTRSSPSEHPSAPCRHHNDRLEEMKEWKKHNFLQLDSSQTEAQVHSSSRTFLSHQLLPTWVFKWILKPTSKTSFAVVVLDQGCPTSRSRSTGISSCQAQQQEQGC